MLSSFLLGLLLMWAAQLGLASFGWLRGYAMTVSGVRIHWENARFRDLVFVLRILAGGVLAPWAVPSISDTNAWAYVVGIVIAFFLPSISEIPVVIMKRWSIEPPSGSDPSDSEGKSRRGRDL